MNKKRKALILLGIAITAIVVSVVVVQFWKTMPKTEGIKVSWNLEDHHIHKSLYIRVFNYGSEPINVTGVEVVYLPDDTQGLLWIEHHIIEPNDVKVFVWYGWYNETMDLEYVGDIENTPERLAFFNLLKAGETEAILEINVATTEGTYTFHPTFGEQVNPTSIEKK